jgi:hypothetical protein
MIRDELVCYPNIGELYIQANLGITLQAQSCFSRLTWLARAWGIATAGGIA